MKALRGLSPGSAVLVSGVSQIQTDEYRNPVSHRILLNAPKDLKIFKKPPLLTAERAAVILLGLGMVILLGAAWLQLLREKVRKQTDQIVTQLQHEAALQAQYRNVVENASDWIYTVDEIGNFGSSNAAGKRITGYTAEEITKVSFDALVHPEDKADFCAKENEGRTGITRQLRLMRKDGGVIWIETRVSPADEGVSVRKWIGIARDITERKVIEQELKLLRSRGSGIA